MARRFRSPTALERDARTSDPIAEAEALVKAGRAPEAAALLDTLIHQGRGGVLARLALARAKLAAGDSAAALASLRETTQLFPGVAEVALAFGETLLQCGHLPVAIGELQRALRLDEGLSRARYLLGCCWLEAGEPDRALAIFSQLGNEPGVAEKIAEAQAMRRAPRAASGYVRHLFDQFAGDYDARMLGELSYRAPAILRELWDLTGGGKHKLDILDLGCGTGLSGAAFKDLAGRLDGVDLSPLMLAQAGARGIYDSLQAADIETALAAGGPQYDLVLAADTLVYLGDLSLLFAGVAGALKSGGGFLFTVERMEGEGFALGAKRRWQHAESYLRAQAIASGFEVSGLMSCTLRNEAKAPVSGFAVALFKS